MLVRSATLADAHAIATIHVETWRAAYAGIVPQAHLDGLSIEQREERWRASLAAPRFETIVAERDGAVIGWATYGPSRDEDAASQVGELMAIYVAAPTWGQGAGRALWQHARQALQRASFSQVTLWTLRDNARALRFYERAGFALEPSSTKAVPIAGVDLVHVRLRCGLNRA